LRRGFLRITVSAVLTDQGGMGVAVGDRVNVAAGVGAGVDVGAGRVAVGVGEGDIVG